MIVLVQLKNMIGTTNTKIEGFTVYWSVHSSAIPHSSTGYAIIHVTRELTNALSRGIVGIMG